MSVGPPINTDSSSKSKFVIKVEEGSISLSVNF